MSGPSSPRAETGVTEKAARAVPWIMYPGTPESDIMFVRDGEQRGTAVWLRPGRREWLGHASIATTRLYDRRKMRPEDIPTFKVTY